MSNAKCLLVGIQPITDPNRPAVLLRATLGLGHQGPSQDRFLTIHPSGEDPARLLGETQADPDLSLQSRALRRSSVS